MLPDILPALLSRLHVRRRRPAVLLGTAIVAILLLCQVPTLLSLTRLAAMRISALSVSTHESAPLPVVVPGLLAASWKDTKEDPKTFLKLHVFSEDTPAGRRRRDTIRRYSPTAWVKPGLVELKFVVPGNPDALLEIDAGDGAAQGALRGFNRTGDGERIPGASDGRRSRNRGGERTTVEERGVADAEADEFRDIIRVPGHDVAAEWISAVGKAEPARWVVKTDDSTLPLLPNMIRDLRKRDWRVPTYFGTTTGRDLDRPFFYRGMMYGFSWPVAATVASARIATGTEVGDAERTGQLMWSLPSSKGMPRLLRGYPCLQTDECAPSFQEGTMRPALFERLRSLPDYPRKDDPRTGLRFVNYLDRIEGPQPWIHNDARTAIAYYGLDEEAYVEKYEKLDKTMRRAGGV